jgi:aminomethyltransferase
VSDLKVSNEKKTETIGGAEVPWTYTSYEDEYEALRGGSGVVDHASLGLIEIAGTDAVSFLQEVVARDIEYLVPERCMTTLLLDANGKPIDIAVLYGTDSGVLVETAFGRGQSTLDYLREHAPTGVEVVDRSGDMTVIGMEGPYAWGPVAAVVGEEFTALPFEGVAPVTFESEQCLFTRSGFTGEYGYKLIGSRETCQTLRARLLDEQAIATGYAALETAMLEVRQPILHREAGEGGTVLSCGWNWLTDFTKESYVGREAVMAEYESGPATLTVGCSIEAPEAVESGAVVLAGDAEIGTVVHCVASPKVSTLALARVQPQYAAAGLDLSVESHAGTAKARSLTSPYVVPQSWSLPIQ